MTDEQPADEILICGNCHQPIEQGQSIRTRRGVFHRGHEPRYRHGYDSRITSPAENREIRPL